MKTNIVSLRYKMKDVLKALSHRERVSVLYHGRIQGVIIPVLEKTPHKVVDHPLFGVAKEEKKLVKQKMQELRGARYHAI